MNKKKKRKEKEGKEGRVKRKKEGMKEINPFSTMDEFIQAQSFPISDKKIFHNELGKLGYRTKSF